MNTISGFLKAFHPGSVAGLTSGVGFSGLIFSILYLVSELFLDFQWICLIVIPSFIIYVIAFYWMISLKAKVEKDVEEYSKTISPQYTANDTLYGSKKEENLKNEKSENENVTDE